MAFEKGLRLDRHLVTFLNVTFLLSTHKVIGIELYEPCDLNDPTSCKQYNSSAVICLPRTPNSPPDDPGICNCVWNLEFPYEYTFNETSLECLALVGSHCSDSEEEPRYCVENGICKLTGSNSFGRCDCLEDFMEDYENATRICVERKLDAFQLCENEGIASKYKCKSFYNFIDNTTTTLACVQFNDTSKWCDCKGNEYEINYKFHNNKCLALVNTSCEGAPCYETSVNSTFCNGEKKCECIAGFSANDDKICIADPDPVSTTTDPVSTTTDPVSTTTDPVSTTTDPVSTTTHPVSTTTDPVSTTTHPVSTTTDPVSTTTHPVSTTTHPVSTTTDPVSTTTHPVSTTTDPVSTTTDPVSATTDPVSTTTDPVSTTTDPVSTTTDPVSTTTDPVSTTTDPVSTTHPVSTTTHPVSTTTHPASTTTDPVSTTTDPVSTTTDPVSTTTDPVSTTTDPVSTTHLVSTTTHPVSTTTGTASFPVINKLVTLLSMFSVAISIVTY